MGWSAVVVLVVFPNRTYFLCKNCSRRIVPETKRALPPWAGLQCVCLCVLVVFPYRTHFYLLFKQTFFKTHCP